MKRVGGHVTWLCELEPRLAALAAHGLKRTTLRRCHIVEAGDTLRLRTGGEADVFMEAEVIRATPFEIFTNDDGSKTDCWAALDGEEITKDEFDELARKDGFRDAADLVEWLDAHSKLDSGVYDGQLIEW